MIHAGRATFPIIAPVTEGWSLPSLAVGGQTAWTCDEASSPLAERISGLAGRGLATVLGAPSFRQPGPPALPEVARYAVAMQTTNDRLLTSDTEAPDWSGLLGDEWAVSCWIYRASGGGQWAGLSDFYFVVRTQVSGFSDQSLVVSCSRNNSTTTTWSYVSGTFLQENVWLHVVAQRVLVGGAPRAQVYVDGVSVFDAPAGLPLVGTATGPFRIGSRGGGPTGVGHRVSQLATWSRALTAPEIAALAAGTAYFRP